MNLNENQIVVYQPNETVRMDKCCQLSASEFADLKSQIATSSWGGIRKAPKVFTEQGVAMLSAVLNSPTAILVSMKDIGKSASASLKWTLARLSGLRRLRLGR